MIIVCKKCKSSFLVPSSLFNEGPRRVKCAKCGESWTCDKKGKSLLKTTVSQEDVDKKAASLRAAAMATQEQPSPPLPPDAPAPEPFSGNEFQRLILWAGTITAGVLVFFSLIFVMFRDQIVQIWPASGPLYITLGLVSPPELDALYLRDIRSIRRYQNGAMHLIVEGVILNQSSEVHVIPEIQVEARGPDGQTIKSWNIQPVQATIKPRERVAFSSAILSPQKSITEVSLRFLETTTHAND
jgi:predicted Zn finger-like uncharacterized protein